MASYLMLQSALSLFLFISPPLSGLPELCGNDPDAVALVKQIVADDAQRRSYLECDSRLVAAATDKAISMAERGFVMHTRANARAREYGFKLPSYYGIGNANQVEAIAGGQRSSDEVWRAFKGSKMHADHLLGRLPFYAEQSKIGVAKVSAPDSPHGVYWAVYIAKEDGDVTMTRFNSQIPNKVP